MSVYRIKIKDLTTLFFQQLQEKYKDSDVELEIRVHGDAENQTIKTPLDDKLFWEIISLLDWSKSEDEAILSPAIQQLAKQDIAQIYLFHDVLSEKLYQLDAKKFAIHIGEDAYNGRIYFSVDNFLYARCCVVANGKELFEMVLKTPSEMPKDLTFESLLSLASKAYTLKTEKEFQYFPHYNYETYSNEEGWTKDN